MMVSIILMIVIGLVMLVIGILVGYILRKSIGEKTIGNAEQKAKNMILDAENRAETVKKELVLEAKEEAHRQRNDLEKEIRERRNEIQKSERRLIQKEESIDRKLENIEKKEESIINKEKSITNKQQEMDKVLKRQLDELEKISGYSTEHAREIILQKVEKEARSDAAALYKDIESKAKEDADKKAKEIITGAIQRCAADHVAESTVSVVPLPNDEMKGRIIGREGRNIRAIETLTGIDLIIDDTPEAVILSGFDPVRREIARLSLEKLIVDGRIHPARIEEMVEKSEREVKAIIKEAGEQATFDVGIHNLHPELVKLLGRLKYRTSYGQNVLKHSVEVAQLAGLMAGELGLDVTLAKRAGLLHDIGKYISMRSHSLYTYKLIMSTDILGFSDNDKKIVALASYYHANQLFENKAGSPEMEKELTPLVAKIAALVRLADAMDRSYQQKIKFCKVSIKDGTMLIEAKSKVDLTLEEWTFAGKATFFEEVYGLKAILERVSE